MFAPRGIGEPCGMFTLPHIVTLFIVLIVVGLLLYKCNGLKEQKIILIIKVMAIIITILEIIKIIYNLHFGYDTLDNYMPLSFCSLFIYSLWLAGYGKGIIKKVGFSFIVGGATICGLSFLIFPTTSLTMHPIYHYLSMYSMFFHGVMLFMGLLIFINNLYKFNLNNYIIYILYCLFFMVIVLILNRIYQSNLMFLSRPFNIPLKIFDNIYNITPILYQISIILVYLTIPYLLIYLISKITKKCNE